MSEDSPDNTGLVEAIERAKQSALPIAGFVIAMAETAGVEVNDIVSAIELALLTVVTGKPTLERMRNSLRIVAEPFAATIDTPWEVVADAILGTLQWTPPDPSTWTLDSWNLQRKRS